MRCLGIIIKCGIHYETNTGDEMAGENIGRPVKRQAGF